MSHGDSSHDDYLHDPSAPPDPEIVALERALRPLRHASAPSERVLDAAPVRSPRRWPWLLVAAAAALLLSWWLVDDAPICEGAPSCRIVAGKEPRTVVVDDRISIELAAGSELTFVHWRRDELRFRLQRGGMVAKVAPPPAVPPRFFVVDTPGATVVDQGCRYELHVGADGGQRVYVTEGAVTFGDRDREVFVPAGAIARLDADGLGTPMFLDASMQLQKLFDRFDELRHAKVAAEERVALVRKIGAVCMRPQDTLPVWHLLAEPDPDLHKAATEILFALAGSPDGGPIGMFSAAQWLEHLRVAAWQAGG
ncbi:MAG: FecR domain-containing protein [Planctomycetota bacterium]